MASSSSQVSSRRSIIAPATPGAMAALDDDRNGDGRGGGGRGVKEEERLAVELRRGPWTVDEDLALVNYITDHGEGRWNSLAQAAGLKRTGKSCRLRWLNYLRPDVKRGNFTADEQLLILDLHSRYGNRWSKIAQHLPGRTDNEIKNYWRTRVQKHAKQLNCDANSKRFKDAMRYLWMPHPHHLVVNNDCGRLLHHAAVAEQDGYYYDDTAIAGDAVVCAAAGLSGMGGVTSGGASSSDSFATTTTSESYDAAAAAFPPKKWAAAGYDDDGGGPGLYANASAAGEVLVVNGGAAGGCWVQETNQQGLCWRRPADDEHSKAPQVNGGGGDGDGDGNGNGGQQQQFEVDPELSGWVQSFSEGITENSFWTLEDIWKMQ